MLKNSDNVPARKSSLNLSVVSCKKTESEDRNELIIKRIRALGYKVQGGFVAKKKDYSYEKIQTKFSNLNVSRACKDAERELLLFDYKHATRNDAFSDTSSKINMNTISSNSIAASNNSSLRDLGSIVRSRRGSYLKGSLNHIEALNAKSKRESLGEEDIFKFPRMNLTFLTEFPISKSSRQNIVMEKKKLRLLKILRAIKNAFHFIKYMARNLGFNRIERGWEYQTITENKLTTRNETTSSYISRKDQYFNGTLVSTMKAFRKYSSEIQKSFLKVAVYEKWQSGRLLVREGHIGRYLFIILQGSVSITILDRVTMENFRKKHNEQKVDTSKMSFEEARVERRKEMDYERAYNNVVSVSKAGDSFGDASFRSEGCIRAASVRTECDSEFLLILKEDFESILSSFANFSKGLNLIELQLQFPLLKSLNFKNDKEISVFDIRVIPPNQAIVIEGEVEETIWFIRSGSVRILKLIKFEKKYVNNKQYILTEIYDEELIGKSIKKHNVVTKLLLIDRLQPGDNFGFHHGIIEYANVEIEKKEEKVYQSSASISDVTIITNTRVEIVGISRFDFRKRATDKSRELVQGLNERRIEFNEIGANYLENVNWLKYKKKSFNSLIEQRKRHV
ncbi:Cyclic nucleotide-binding domain-containing protein 2 [Lobulomyces angularis]|nr:Cyclic nucleotide-binding domain-containing protein 2 [Lobulomyces angularis]